VYIERFIFLHARFLTSSRQLSFCLCMCLCVYVCVCLRACDFNEGCTTCHFRTLVPHEYHRWKCATDVQLSEYCIQLDYGQHLNSDTFWSTQLAKVRSTLFIIRLRVAVSFMVCCRTCICPCRRSVCAYVVVCFPVSLCLCTCVHTFVHVFVCVCVCVMCFCMFISRCVCMCVFRAPKNGIDWAFLNASRVFKLLRACAHILH